MPCSSSCAMSKPHVRINELKHRMWQNHYADYPVLLYVELDLWFSLIPQYDQSAYARQMAEEMRHWCVCNFGNTGWMFDEQQQSRNIVLGLEDAEQATAFIMRWNKVTEY